MKPVTVTTKSNPYLKHFRARMRRYPTNAERWMSKLLWDAKVKFSKQQIFKDGAGGAYIIDFWCYELRVVVECDGAGHYTKCGQKKDARRDAKFAACGIKVVRLENKDVFKLDASKVRALLEA